MSRHEDRKRAVVEFYDGLLAEKSGSEVLGFGTEDSQRIRFEVLLGGMEGASVLDVGCGRGDLLGHLRDRGLVVDYRGVDIHPGMVERARATWPGDRFEVRDILEDDGADEVDSVLSSGIFGLTPNGDADFVTAMLERMFRLARRAVAVNFLSTWTPWEQDPRSWYADPVETLALARRLTPNVVLRHDYRPNDFTLYLRHAAPGEAR